MEGKSPSLSPSLSLHVALLLYFCLSLCSRNLGNKPANSPKGQPPDSDGHSSVSDLANSLTGDMVMVRWWAVECVLVNFVHLNPEPLIVHLIFVMYRHSVSKEVCVCVSPIPESKVLSLLFFNSKQLLS